MAGTQHPAKTKAMRTAVRMVTPSANEAGETRLAAMSDEVIAKK
jgi:hypothetical protein